MNRCPRCDWRYPDLYLHPYIGTMWGGKPICGRCAADIRKELVGVDRPFTGEMAQQAVEDADEWRATHPKDGPR
jgi:hypothetical protein